MYFKKIEMHGFKSFAEPVTIDFSSGITCIVGPNGSGKSNISDAIRWVLGEQSPKMLRGGKMEEVIFSGTSSRKSRGMAEVTLVIDNAEGTLPIDYKEVALTRRMFRSGESEYHINGNQCRLRDIRELIMDTGIGVDGYSIIGQGKISEILSNKTESRREIFEEAAGIVLYRTKKAESERKLEAANANMDRVQDIIGEIEGRIDGLKEDSIKAKEYLKLRDRYKELEINIILKNIENLKAKSEGIHEDLKQLDESLAKTRGERSAAEQSAASHEERKETLESIAEETRTQLMEVIDELNHLVSQEQIDKERLGVIAENQERLTAEIQELQEKLQREEENQKSLLEGSRQTEERFAQAKTVLDEKVELYDSLSQKLASLMQQADQHKNEVFEHSGDRSSAEAEISSLQRMAETLERRKAALLSDKDSGEDSNKETLDNLNQMRHEKERIVDNLEHIKEQRLLKKEEFAAMREDEKKLSRTFEDLRISLSQLSARKKTIEEMESNYEGYNYAVRYIMRSGLSGIHGVVADLITVPEGYETAIETALGAGLQNIVCENDESAKAAIRALKANKAGRLTFLPVSSVRGRTSYEERLRQEAGFRGFGPECLTFDPRYQGVISYLLGRVVIVDDMDHAVRMSKKGGGLRFVTLDGEVINAGGAITGGKYKNKTANILDRKAEIQSLEKE
ncbi:MAG: chromosome segregation protein SMC, partial [Clostridia bacterium]